MRRQIAFGAVAIVVLAVVAFFVVRLKPAAPVVDRATIWTDTVKRGPLLRQVRGPGTLVPREDKIRLIPAETEATVVRIRVLPGAKVEPDTLLMDLVDPTLQQELLDAQLQLKGAEADLHEHARQAAERPDDAEGRRRDGGRGQQAGAAAGDDRQEPLRPRRHQRA